MYSKKTMERDKVSLWGLMEDPKPSLGARTEHLKAFESIQSCYEETAVSDQESHSTLARLIAHLCNLSSVFLPAPADEHVPAAPPVSFQRRVS